MVPDHGQGGFHSVAPFWKIRGQVREILRCRAAVRSRLLTHDTFLLYNTTNRKRLGHASDVSAKTDRKRTEVHLNGATFGRSYVCTGLRLHRATFVQSYV